MKPINDRLFDLYSRYQAGIDAIFDRPRKGEPFLDGPHLLYCWEEAYHRAKYKILFLGQENHGWLGEPDSIEGLLQFCQEFEHGKAYGKGLYWPAVHHFNKCLNGETADRLGFVAGNVSKYCSETGGRVTQEDHRFIVQNLNVLSEELDILQPDVVIFFSGPVYDDWIRAQLEGGQLSFEPLTVEIPSRELARVKHPSLPHHTYRTYHPKYLQLRGKWNFIQLITAAIAGCSIDKAFRTFQSQMSELAVELGLQLEAPPIFAGRASSGFYFSQPEWRWCQIGFEFDADGAGSFFYGICKNGRSGDVPTAVREKFKGHLPEGDGVTEYWPWWRWFEHRDWNEKTFREIMAGITKEKVYQILADFLARLEDVEM